MRRKMGMFFPDDPDQPVGRKKAAAIHQTCKSADQVIKLGIQLSAGLIYMTFFRGFAPAVTHHALHALPQQRLVDFRGDFSGAAFSPDNIPVSALTPAAINKMISIGSFSCAIKRWNQVTFSASFSLLRPYFSRRCVAS